MAKVAEVLVQTLIEAGVKRVYGVAGDSLNGMTETIRKSDKIKWLHVRHEEVAGFAAGAEAILANEIAVCAGSCGPGNLHLINGLFDCQRSVSLSLQSQPKCRATRSAAGTFRRPKQLAGYLHIQLRKRGRQIANGQGEIQMAITSNSVREIFKGLENGDGATFFKRLAFVFPYRPGDNTARTKSLNRTPYRNCQQLDRLCNWIANVTTWLYSSEPVLQVLSQ